MWAIKFFLTLLWLPISTLSWIFETTHAKLHMGWFFETALYFIFILVQLWAPRESVLRIWFLKGMSLYYLLIWSKSKWATVHLLGVVQWKPLNVLTGLCYQPLYEITLPVSNLMKTTKKQLVNVINHFMLSLSACLNVITLSGFYCTGIHSCLQSWYLVCKIRKKHWLPKVNS